MAILRGGVFMAFMSVLLMFVLSPILYLYEIISSLF